ncbi:MAG TPA: hypothetical protein DDZ51_28810 [Planctomycetaceae bacterium]|nr:hypothetical protein [Planctomycetaceae bacterium]
MNRGTSKDRNVALGRHCLARRRTWWTPTVESETPKKSPDQVVILARKNDKIQIQLQSPATDRRCCQATENDFF